MPGDKSQTCYSKEVDSIFMFFSSGAPQAIRIYLPNCLYAYCWRMYWIFGGCCSSFYTDQDFPPQELNVVTMTCALHDCECLRSLHAVQRVEGRSYIAQCFAQTLFSQNSRSVFHDISCLRPVNTPWRTHPLGKWVVTMPTPSLASQAPWANPGPYHNISYHFPGQAECCHTTTKCLSIGSECSWHQGLRRYVQPFYDNEDLLMYEEFELGGSSNKLSTDF